MTQKANAYKPQAPKTVQNGKLKNMQKQNKNVLELVANGRTKKTHANAPRAKNGNKMNAVGKVPHMLHHAKERVAHGKEKLMAKEIKDKIDNRGGV